jgi:hypothetical protein
MKNIACNGTIPYKYSVLVLVIFLCGFAVVTSYPLRAQTGNSWKVYNCQKCLRNLKSCKEILADMNSPKSTFGAEAAARSAASGQARVCTQMQYQCQEMCY